MKELVEGGCIHLVMFD